jgi:hypothetical protein
LPLTLQGHESCFVVFSNNRNEKGDSNYSQNFPELKVVQKLDKPWEVEFVNKKFGPLEPLTLNTLTSWTELPNEKAKYYSGTAVYKTKFNLEEIPEGELYINLGDVGVMAEIKINGQDIGGVWIHPFRLNTKNTIKTGENSLEIEVVNLWRNRIVGDKALALEERFAWTIFDDADGKEKLQPSGLLGPVTFETYIK